VIIPLQFYYVLDGTIYQAPDFYAIVENRFVLFLFVFNLLLLFIQI